MAPSVDADVQYGVCTGLLSAWRLSGSRERVSRYARLGVGRSVIANCLHCWHYAVMGIQITIRDVPEEVRDELASRAALERKSMQEYLREALERLAARPSIHTWLERVRDRKRAAESRVSARQILKHRDADRR